jgi:hypothetical protein
MDRLLARRPTAGQVAHGPTFYRTHTDGVTSGCPAAKGLATLMSEACTAEMQEHDDQHHREYD